MSTVVAAIRFLAIVFGFEVLVILLLISGPSILAHNDLGESGTLPYEASLRITPGGGISGSSYPENFVLRNETTSNQKITSVRIDLSTAVSSNIVFTADSQFSPESDKALTSRPVEDTGFSGYQYQGEHEGRFDILELDFEELDPGEEFPFFVNVTANNSHGTTAYVTNKLGNTSGLDLMGSTVTVRFDDGTELTGQTLHIRESNGESEAHLHEGLSLLSPTP
ncbi:MAG: hypothetical protein ACK2T4_07285 [Candidatus Promineifilaceae bacterium]|jgi:hypothetical protein